MLPRFTIVTIWVEPQNSISPNAEMPRPATARRYPTMAELGILLHRNRPGVVIQVVDGNAKAETLENSEPLGSDQ